MVGCLHGWVDVMMVGDLRYQFGRKVREGERVSEELEARWDREVGWSAHARVKNNGRRRVFQSYCHHYNL